MRIPCVPLLLLTLFACGSESAPQEASSAKRAMADGPASEPGQAVTDDEQEAANEEFLSVAPAFSDDYIFVANPTIDSISKIKVTEPHPIEIIPVGLYPSLVKSVGKRVLVLNSGDHTVTFITAATSKTFTVSIPKEINDIVFNELGHGIAYVNKAKLPPKIENGTLSTDMFSIIHIESGLVVTKGISFAPKHIVFTRSNPPMTLLAADSKGVLVNLDTPTAKPAVLNFSQDLSVAVLEEAAITPNGTRAFFREREQTGIRVLELGTNTLSSLAGDAVPTDMDLSPDGSILYVSDRLSGYRLRRYDATTAALTLYPSPVTSSLAYRQTEFTPDGAKAVLFSNSDDQTYVGIYDVAAGTVTDVEVQRPVQNVIVAPDSRSAIIVHRNAVGTFHPQKLTMLNLITGEEPDVDLQGDLDKIDFTPDGNFAFVTTRTPDYIIALSLRSGLHNVRALQNSPIFLSALPGTGGGHAFVTQTHESGHITFITAEQTLSNVRITPDEVIGFLLGTTAE